MKTAALILAVIGFGSVAKADDYDDYIAHRDARRRVEVEKQDRQRARFEETARAIDEAVAAENARYIADQRAARAAEERRRQEQADAERLAREIARELDAVEREIRLEEQARCAARQCR